MYCRSNKSELQRGKYRTVLKWDLKKIPGGCRATSTKPTVNLPVLLSTRHSSSGAALIALRKLRFCEGGGWTMGIYLTAVLPAADYPSEKYGRSTVHLRFYLAKDRTTEF
ncbi:hypothetical protein CHISP_0882 [Chitinispirillum alkaliphilum]|nr:hypothetical protein CHISP_0882 [Chitinispirillum alkaliphilum]